jgi:hypothetical protein
MQYARLQRVSHYQTDLPAVPMPSGPGPAHNSERNRSHSHSYGHEGPETNGPAVTFEERFINAKIISPHASPSRPSRPNRTPRHKDRAMRPSSPSVVLPPPNAPPPSVMPPRLLPQSPTPPIVPGISTTADGPVRNLSLDSSRAQVNAIVDGDWYSDRPPRSASTDAAHAHTQGVTFAPVPPTAAPHDAALKDPASVATVANGAGQGPHGSEVQTRDGNSYRAYPHIYGKADSADEEEAAARLRYTEFAYLTNLTAHQFTVLVSSLCLLVPIQP